MQTHQQVVSSFYLSYYGRPADVGGLKFWTEQLNSVNGNLDAILDAFATSPEFTLRFGIFNPSQHITHMYQELLGREPESLGLTYWLSEVSSGRKTIGQLAIDIYAGATGEDLALVQARQLLADNFTANLPVNGTGYAGLGAIEVGRLVVQAINAETTPARMKALVTSGAELAAAATAKPEVIAALIGPKGSLSDLLDTTAGAASPLTLIKLLNTIVDSAPNAAALNELLGKGTLVDLINDLPPGASLTELNNAITNGGFDAGADVVYPPAGGAGGGAGGGDGDVVNPPVTPPGGDPVTPTPTYTLAGPAASVNEGADAVFTLTTTNVANGTVLTYTLSGVQAADVTSGLLTGTVTVNNNTATITVPLVADTLTEGAETLTVTVGGKTASVVVNDTSLSVNSAPTIAAVPTVAEAVITGTPFELADFTVADADDDELTVTLTQVNGVIGGAGLPAAVGNVVTLTGTAADINALLAAATFTATADGAASIAISVSDGVNTAVTSTYSLTATAAGTAFTVIDTSGILTFGGTATGAITFTVDAATGEVTFTRGGVAATDKPVLSAITSATADVGTITLAANVADLSAANATKLTTISGFLLGSSTYSLKDGAAALAGADAGVLANATAITVAPAASIADIEAIVTKGGVLATMTFALTDELQALDLVDPVAVAGLVAAQDLAKAAAKTAAGDIVAKASNVDTLVVNNGAYSLADTATLLADADADAGVLTGAAAIEVTGTTAAASDLVTLETKALRLINAASVTAINGSVEDVTTVVTSGGITKAANFASTVLGNLTPPDLVNLKTITDATTGVVTASITDSAAHLATLESQATNAITMHVTGTAAVADLLALVGKTSVKIDAALVTAITGTTGADTIDMTNADIDYYTLMGTGKTITGAGGNDIIAMVNDPFISDTLVFEATAAGNGIDTITGFQDGETYFGGDVLDVSAFIGAAAAVTLGATIASGSVDLTGKNVLTLTDIQMLTTANFGNLAEGDVIQTQASKKYFVVADVAGDTDAIQNLYYVTTSASNVATVTLVGTMNEVTLTADNIVAVA